MKKYISILLIIPLLINAQSRWKRSQQDIPVTVDLFHASQMADLPTTQTLSKHDLLFEISHRFNPINGGYDDFFGFDGGVTMRIGLGYGITDDLMITMGRSNILDNLDIHLKYKILDLDHQTMPSALAINGGIAFNTEPAYNLKAFNTDYMQYFAQLVYNVMFLDKKLGIGFVPSFVYNSYILEEPFGYDVENQTTIALGTYYKYYFNRMWSTWLEYTPVLSGYNDDIFDKSIDAYNPMALGIAIETGGHIFNVFITNNSRLNATQYLTGSDGDTGKKAWRFAFSIIRVL